MLEKDRPYCLNGCFEDQWPEKPALFSGKDGLMMPSSFSFRENIKIQPDLTRRIPGREKK
jgi:hypothetical protein